MKDLSPSSIHELSSRIKENEDLAVKYLQNKHALGPADGKKVYSCDQTCRNRATCWMTNSHYWGFKQCIGEKPIDFSDPLTLFEILGEPWMEGPKPF